MSACLAMSGTLAAIFSFEASKKWIIREGRNGTSSTGSGRADREWAGRSCVGFSSLLLGSDDSGAGRYRSFGPRLRPGARLDCSAAIGPRSRGPDQGVTCDLLRIPLIVLALVGLVAVAGCGGSDSTDSTDSSSSEALTNEEYAQQAQAILLDFGTSFQQLGTEISTRRTRSSSPTSSTRPRTRSRVRSTTSAR